MDHISKALEKARRLQPTPKPTAKPTRSSPSEEQAPAPMTTSPGEASETPPNNEVGTEKSPPAEKADPAVAPSKDGASDKKANGSLNEVGAQSIVYNQTRTVHRDPNQLAEQRLIAGLRHDPRSSVFQLLRTQVLMKLRKESWHSLAITSAAPGAGKSLVATNLAVAISQEVNQTVLLVDMDLIRPKVSEYFGLTPKFGILDHLIDDVPLSDVFVNPGMERLVLLPAKGEKDLHYTSEMLSTPKTRQLLHDIKTRYESRIVIFDVPPLLPTDDALVVVQQVDAVLMVVEDGRTTEDQIVQSLRLLEGTELLGTVLNKSNVRSQAYYYN